MIAAIRLRGKVKTPKKIEDTLQMLNLNNVYNCVIIPENPSHKGMLQKTKDYITWGEINKKTLKELIEKRTNTDKNAENIIKNKEKIKFRLHPPKKGFKGTKKQPIGKKGELGYRGEEINQLIKKMI